MGTLTDRTWMVRAKGLGLYVLIRLEIAYERLTDLAPQLYLTALTSLLILL